MDKLKSFLPGKRSASSGERRIGVYIARDGVTLSIIGVDGATLEQCVARECTHETLEPTLTDLVTEFALRGVPAYVTLDREDYDTQFVDVPGVSDSDLRDALAWQVTPPEGLDNSEIVTTGTRLSGDGGDGQQSEGMVRATVMASSLLETISMAMTTAGLNLQAVYPRETTLITLANATLGTGDKLPAVMSVFVTRKGSSITIAEGDELHLSRMLRNVADEGQGLDDGQIRHLIRECNRTASTFSARFKVPLGAILIGPSFEGIDALRDQIREQVEVRCDRLSVADAVASGPSADATMLETSTGMLAVASALATDWPTNASMYVPETVEHSFAAPRFLGALSLGVIAMIGAMSGYQYWELSGVKAELSGVKSKQTAITREVGEIERAIETAQDRTARPALIERRESLRAELAKREELIGQFNAIEGSSIESIHAVMRSLSQVSNENIWVERMTLEPNRSSLSGQTVNPISLERFIDRIGQTGVFDGWNPEIVDIADPKPEMTGEVVRRFDLEGGAIYETPTTVSGEGQ